MESLYKPKTFKSLLQLAFVCILMIMLISCSSDRSSDDHNGGVKPGPTEKTSKQEDLEKPEDEEEIKETEMETDNITINTQSSIRIEGSKVIYIDPYKRSEKASDADLVLITHAHYDHFDEASIKNVIKEDTFFVCPESMFDDVTQVMPGHNGDGLEPGTSGEAGDTGVKVETVPAYNDSKTFHPKDNGWVGYLIELDGVKYYAAGDTDALSELEDIDCDIAFVPIGGTYTMTAKEAAVLVNKIKPSIVIPIHYGSIVGSKADEEVFRDNVGEGIEVVTKVEDAK